MTPVLKLQVKMSELRGKINQIGTVRELDESELANYNELCFTLSGMEAEYREALENQTDWEREAAQHMNDNAIEPLPAEHRERQAITRKAKLVTIVDAVIAQRAATGAEREAQAAWQCEMNEIPLPMLPGVEMRVIDAPNDGSGPRTLQYVFGGSMAQAANVVRPAVPPGTYTFPSFVDGTAGARPAITAENADVDPTMRGELLVPNRVQANTTINIEDRARFPDLGTAVARHLRNAIVAGLDVMALSDDNGFFDSTNGPLTPETNPASATTWAQATKWLSDGVDGRWAASAADVTVIMNGVTYADIDALYRGTNTNESAAEVIERRGRLVVNANIPAVASNISQVLIARGRTQAAIQPIWANIGIEDIFTNSKSGQIAFTAVTLTDFSVQHPAAYAWVKNNSS